MNKSKINASGCWSLGLLQMDFFWRNRPWYAGQFIRKIEPKFKLNKNSILFFTTILNKQKPKLLSVLVRDVDKTFLNSTIYLPILENSEIDFEFINSFIAELEAERVAELEAYLSITGLVDHVLTDEEQKAIANIDKLEYKAFNLKKLFGKSTRGKRLKSADRINGNLPFVTAGEANEGISDFIGNEVTIFPRNTTTIDMFGSAKYRSYEYGGDDHVAIVHTEKLEENAAIFVTAAIHKSSHNGQFNYGHNLYAKDADELNILLPANGDEPNYKSMATLISAVKKLVIRDVVNYTDKKIAAMKKVV